MNDDATSSQNTYVVGYSPAMHTMMSQRTITGDAGFLLPHLRPGMRLLDCGAGPGTITLGLAEAVAPGEVIGIDISPVQVERASALAAQRGIWNVRFELGDITALPFADASFDVAFAHTVLMHLRDPVAALHEMRRVVRPGGIVAARDNGFYLSEPRTPEFEQFLEMMACVSEASVGRPTPAMGLQHRRLLIEAGLSRAEGYADVTAYGTPELLRENATVLRGVLDSEGIRRALASAGYDDDARERIAEDRFAWSERPDAIVVIIWSAGIGWVD